ncbi:MAG: hypothetical protein LBH91_00615 [Prevotellaceae bacterium]|jgi:hypothetical protein|nr:hypothetical protein [Prevotellaceae bacterium]
MATGSRQLQDVVELQGADLIVVVLKCLKRTWSEGLSMLSFKIIDNRKE